MWREYLNSIGLHNDQSQWTFTHWNDCRSFYFIRTLLPSPSQIFNSFFFLQHLSQRTVLFFLNLSLSFFNSFCVVDFINESCRWCTQAQNRCSSQWYQAFVLCSLHITFPNFSSPIHKCLQECDIFCKFWKEVASQNNSRVLAWLLQRSDWHRIISTTM